MNNKYQNKMKITQRTDAHYIKKKKPTQIILIKSDISIWMGGEQEAALVYFFLQSKICSEFSNVFPPLFF